MKAQKKALIRAAFVEIGIAAKECTPKALVGPKVLGHKMNKKQVIQYLAQEMEIRPRQISAFFYLLFEIATTQTRRIGVFTIPGLGKLIKLQRAARIGRNPATGEAIDIKARTTVTFRLARSMRDAIKGPRIGQL